MNKELEALDWVENVFEEHHVQLPDVELTLIREALTPPTADEVIKSLSDYLKDKVIYNDRFGFICNERVIICLYPNNVLSFNKNYPAHIHNIVGRFYESLEGEN